MTAILTVQSVEKSFGPHRVLAGVSFAVHERDRIGLVGVNGCGKSTLLRMLAGDDDAGPGPGEGMREDRLPDAGLITRRRGLRIAYVAQEPRLDVERRVAEVLRDGLREHAAALAALAAVEERIEGLDERRQAAALGEQAALHDRIAALGGFDREHELRGISAALGLPPPEAIVGTLSIGERRRVALGRALLLRPELLALDEPTNHLDARTVVWLEERLAAYEGALLVVTHDRYLLDRVATRILELDRGALHGYVGGYSRFLEKQAERLAVEEAREAARASFVRRELDWIRRGPKARATKQKARIDRFDEAVAARPGFEDRTRGPMSLRLPTGPRLGKTILELRGVGKSLGGKRLYSDLTLLVKPGDRIGVVGENGAGKTTLVRTVLGQVTPDAGEVVVGQNTRFAWLDQARAALRDDRTVLEEVAGDAEHVPLPDGPVHVRTFLRLMLFDDRFADTPVGTLSGGERNRVQLAKLLRAGGNFLVLDEPTNDLDLITLGVLEEALVDFPGCALVVSHDRWFLDRVATSILAFEGDGRVSFHEGSYSDYLAKREREARAARAEKPEPTAPAGKPAAASPPRPAAKRRLTFKEKEELGGIEAAIVAAEERARTLEAQLAEPATYKERAAEVPSLVAALEAAKHEVERLYARWQELEAIGA